MDATQNTVMVAIAETEVDDLVVRVGIAAARAYGADLHLAHVVPVVALGGWFPVSVKPLSESTRHRFDCHLTRVCDDAPDLSVTGTLHCGTPAVDLVKAARAARLLVVGRESKHGVGRLLLGSVTASVAAHAQCPVRVVPPDRAGNPDGPVVVALAGPSGAGALLEHAAEVAAATTQHLVVVHTWPLPLDTLENSGSKASSVRTAVAGLVEEISSRQGLTVTTDVAAGDPVAVLTRHSETASLLVLHRPRFPVLGGHLGHVTRHLLAASQAPVELVPGSATPTGG